MSKNQLNVFTYHFNPWKYPHNWMSNIRQFFHNFKYAYQRATKGYCDADMWELFNFYGNLISSSLNDLADNHYGFPDKGEMNTDEKWTQALKLASQHFSDGIKDSFDDPIVTAAYDKYTRHIVHQEFVPQKDGTSVLKTIYDDDKEAQKAKDVWKEKELEFEDWSKTELQLGFKFLSKWFYSLWD